jgi:hypothetical protein
MHVAGWIPLVGSDVPAGRCVQDSLQREPLASHGRTITYSALYNSHPHKLLSFLRDSRAASRPPDFGPPFQVAPEPD